MLLHRQLLVQEEGMLGDLPADLVDAILEKVDTITRAQLAVVCKQWRDLSFQNWQSFSHPRYRVPAAWMDMLATSSKQSLRNFEFHVSFGILQPYGKDPMNTPQDLAYLLGMPWSIQFEQVYFTNKTVPHLIQEAKAKQSCLPVAFCTCMQERLRFHKAVLSVIADPYYPYWLKRHKPFPCHVVE